MHAEWPVVVVVLEGHPEVRASFRSDELEAGNLTPLRALRNMITSEESPLNIERLPFTDLAAIETFTSGKWWFQGAKGIVPRRHEHGDSFKKHALRNGGSKDKRLQCYDHSACFPQSAYSMAWHDPSDAYHCDMFNLRRELVPKPHLMEEQEHHICSLLGVPRTKKKARTFKMAHSASSSYSARQTLSVLRTEKHAIHHTTPLVLIAVPLSIEVKQGEVENPLVAEVGAADLTLLRYTAIPQGNIHTTWTGANPMHIAARRNRPKDVLPFLEDALRKNDHPIDRETESTQQQHIVQTLFFLTHALNMSHKTPFDVAILHGSEEFIIELLQFFIEKDLIFVFLRSELVKVATFCIRARLRKCVEFLFKENPALIRYLQTPSSTILQEKLDGLGDVARAEFLEGRHPLTHRLIPARGERVASTEEAAMLTLTAEVLSYNNDPTILILCEPFIEWERMLDLSPFFRPGRVSTSVLAHLFTTSAVKLIENKLKWSDTLIDLLYDNSPALQYLLSDAVPLQIQKMVQRYTPSLLHRLLRYKLGKRQSPGGFTYRAASDHALFDRLLQNADLSRHILVRAPKYPYKEQYKNGVALAIENNDMTVFQKVLSKCSAEDVGAACLLSKQRHRNLLALTPLCYALCLKKKPYFDILLAKLQNVHSCTVTLKSELPWMSRPEVAYGGLPGVTEEEVFLPKEIWTQVVSFLLPQELGRFQGVCRGVFRLVTESDQWVALMPYLHHRSQSISAPYRKIRGQGQQPLPDAATLIHPQHIYKHAYHTGVYRLNCACFVEFLPSDMAMVGVRCMQGDREGLPGFTVEKSPQLGSGFAGAKSLFLLPGSMVGREDAVTAAGEVDMILTLYSAEKAHRAQNPPYQPTWSDLPHSSRKAPFTYLMNTEFATQLAHSKTFSDNDRRLMPDGLYSYTHPLLRVVSLFGLVQSFVMYTNTGSDKEVARLEGVILGALQGEMGGLQSTPVGLQDFSHDSILEGVQNIQQNQLRVDQRALLGNFWHQEEISKDVVHNARRIESSAGSSSASDSSVSETPEPNGFTSFVSKLKQGMPGTSLPRLCTSLLGECIRTVNTSKPILEYVWKLCGPSFLECPARFEDIKNGSVLSHALYHNNATAVDFFLQIGNTLRKRIDEIDRTPPSAFAACKLIAADFSFSEGEPVDGMNDTIFDQHQDFLHDILSEHNAGCERGVVDTAILAELVETQFTLGRRSMFLAAKFTNKTIFATVVSHLQTMLQQYHTANDDDDDDNHYLTASSLFLTLPILPATVYCSVQRGDTEGMHIVRYLESLVATMTKLGGVAEGMHERGAFYEYERIASWSTYNRLGNVPLDTHLERFEQRVLDEYVEEGLSTSFKCCILPTPFAKAEAEAASTGDLPSPSKVSCSGAMHEVTLAACFLGREKVLSAILLSGYYNVDTEDPDDEGSASHQNVKVKQLFLSAASGKQRSVLLLLAEIFLSDSQQGRARFSENEVAYLSTVLSGFLPGHSRGDIKTVDEVHDDSDAEYVECSTTDTSSEDLCRLSDTQISLLSVGEPRNRATYAFNVMALPCTDVAGPFTSDISLEAISSMGSWKRSDLLARSVIAVERTATTSAECLASQLFPLSLKLAPIALSGGVFCYELFDSVNGRGWGVVANNSRASSGAWHALYVKGLLTYSKHPGRAPLILARRLTLRSCDGSRTLSMPLVARVYHPQPYSPVRFVQVVLSRETYLLAAEAPQAVLTQKAKDVNKIWVTNRAASSYVFVAPTDPHNPQHYSIVYIGTPETTDPFLLDIADVRPDMHATPTEVFFRTPWDQQGIDGMLSLPHINGAVFFWR